MESTENSLLPLTFSEQFLWNRDFALRWDLTRNLHMNFQSATHAEIEEPYTPINKDLYADRYQAGKTRYGQALTLRYTTFRLPTEFYAFLSTSTQSATYL